MWLNKKSLSRVFWFFAWLLFPHWAQAQVTAGFTASPTSGCSPLIVYFTDQLQGNVTDWFWIFGNGATSDTANPVVTFTQPGTYDVTLIVTDGNQYDTLTIPGMITVYESPTAALSGSPLAGCPPLNVQFQDLSQPGDGGITTWLWDFGDGQLTGTQNPSHIYTYASSFTVSLQVTDDNGCTDVQSIPAYVQVKSPPVVQFNTPDWLGCTLPHTAHFNNQSTGTGNLTYQWDFGDGNTSTQKNPVHDYTAFGSYDVTLIVTDGNGCSDTLVISKAVTISPFQVSFSVNKNHGCTQPLDTFLFTNTSQPFATVASWDFGDGYTATGNNVWHVYNVPGTYIVQLTSSNPGCSGTVYDTIYVQELQAGFLASDTHPCDTTDVIQFTDVSYNAVSWSWDFGDSTMATGPNPGHVFQSAGNHLVTLAVANAYGCVDTVAMFVWVDPLRGFPIVTPGSGCAPLKVLFAYLKMSNQNIMSYDWDFGDGQAGTGDTISHTYASQGVYWAKVTVTSDSGCVHTDSVKVEVGVPPTADFMVSNDTFCAGKTVTFLPFNTNADAFFWNYGDGQSGPPFQHIYHDTGWFTVTLYPSLHGCPGDTVKKTNLLYINGPVANPVTDTIPCGQDYDVNFHANAILAQHYKWYFGDGDSSDLADPKHTYAQSGDYLVSLTVSNDSTGCSYTSEFLLFIRKPLAYFTMSDSVGCNTLYGVQFDASGSQDVDNEWYFWEFSDTAFFDKWDADSLWELIHPVYNYTVPGVYTPTLTVHDYRGCYSSFSRTIRITRHETRIYMDTLIGCAPAVFQFIDSTIADSVITSWLWDFGDSVAANQQNPVHTYTQGGIYEVILQTSDVSGCGGSDTVMLTIYDPSPQFYTNDTLVCAGSIVKFNNTTTDTAATFLWLFGDGTSSTQTNPVHVYDKAGNYTVRLIETGPYGCKDTFTISSVVEVHKPSAGIWASDTVANCPPAFIHFSAVTDSSVVGWLWDFGDNSSSVLKNPSHNYTLPGIYDAWLKVWDTLGCTDSIYLSQYIIVNGPVAQFDFFPKSGCFPLAVTFYSFNQQGVGDVFWDFGDGTSGSGDTVTHVYTNYGQFWPVMIINNGMQGAQKCEYGIASPYSVNIDTVHADFSFTPSSACMPADISLFDQSLGDISSRTWLLSNGFVFNGPVPPPQHYDTAGTYFVTLVVTNANGCSDTMTRSLEIFPLPDAKAWGDSVICAGDSILLKGEYNPDLVYLWLPSGSVNDPDSNFTWATPSADQGYVLMVMDTNGCQDFSDTVHAFVLQPPQLSVYPDTTIYAGDTVHLHYDANQPMSGFTWKPAGSLSCGQCPDPLAFPLQTTDYTLTATDSLGCFTLTASLHIEVLDGLILAFPEAFTPNGDGHNDVINLRMKGKGELLIFRIYNRWGQLVFETTDLHKGWDGNYRGKPQPADSYAWYIKVRSQTGQVYEKSGTFTLLR